MNNDSKLNSQIRIPDLPSDIYTTPDPSTISSSMQPNTGSVLKSTIPNLNTPVSLSNQHIADGSDNTTFQPVPNAYISSENFLHENNAIFSEVNSMKFSKPRIRKTNDFQSKFAPNILKDLQMMAQIADNFESCDSDFKSYMNNLVQQQNIKHKARNKRKNESAIKKFAIQTRQLSSDNIDKLVSTNIMNFQPGSLRLITIEIKNHTFYALVDTGASSTIINKTVADKLHLKCQPIQLHMTTATGSSGDNCSGLTQLKFKTLSTENIPIYFSTQAVICKQTNNFDLILGSNLLFDNATSSIQSDFWTFQQSHNSFQIPLLTVGPNYRSKLSITPLNTTVLQPFQSATIAFKISDDAPVKRGDIIRIDNYLLPTQVKLIASNAHIQYSDIEQTKYIKIIATNLNDSRSDINNFTACTAVNYSNVARSSQHDSNSQFDSVFTKDDKKIAAVDKYIESPTIHSHNKKLTFSNNLPPETTSGNLQLPDHFAENHMNTYEAVIFDSDKSHVSYKEINLDHLSSDLKKDFSSILQDNNEAFARHQNDIGLCTLLKHDIDIKNVPPSQQQRFLPHNKQLFAQQQVDTLCRAGIVRLETQPLTVTNLCLIPKYHSIRDNTKASNLLRDDSKIKSYRLVQDLRDVNAATLNVERTNRVCLDDFVKNLNGKIVSALDILSAYYHIELTDRAKKLTGFYLKNSVYTWNRMTQGLISAAATLTKLWTLVFTTSVLNEFKTNLNPTEIRIFHYSSYNDFVQAYFDDFFVFTDTMELHKLALRAVLYAFIKANIRLSPSKSEIAVTRFKILGYQLDTLCQYSTIDDNRVQSILDWPRPSSLYEVQSRVATCGYFTKYLPYLKTYIFPLLSILRSKTFLWDEYIDQSWRFLKLLVIMQIKNTIPKSDEQLYIFSDASSFASSQNLFVMRDDSLQLVATNSKIFGYTDSNKSAYLKECLSLCLCFKQFYHYLTASQLPPIILTDAKSLLSISKSKSDNLSAANMANFLAFQAQILGFKLFHLPGKFNWFSDLFSRSFTSSSPLRDQLATMKDNYFKLKHPFTMNSDNLYDILTSRFTTDKVKQVKPPKPLSNIAKIYRNLTPEYQFVTSAEFLLKERQNDLSNQLDKPSINRTTRLAQNTVNHIHFLSSQDKREFDADLLQIADNSSSNTDLNTHRVDSNFQCKVNAILLNFQDHLLQFNKQILFNESVDKDTFHQLQQNDSNLASIYARLQNNDFQVNKLYVIHDNILYKRSHIFDKICIPFNILQQLIRFIHESKGHISPTKILDYFNLYYHSDKVRKFANKTVENCFICQSLNTPPSVQRRPGTKRFFQPSYPREGWSFDLITNLPKSHNNFTTILLAMDIFSKYAVAYFLENKTQKQIASAVFSHIANFGTPKFIISDSDAALIAVFQPLAQKHSFFYSTSPPKAQHLNLVERIYKELKQMIKKFIYDPQTASSDRRDWPHATILAIQAINALPIRSLHFSREQVMFRFENQSKLFYDPQLNASLSHLDKKILDDMLKYLSFHKTSTKPPYDKFFVDQIVYIKDNVPHLPSENQAFKSYHRGPLKITTVNNDRRTAICFCPDTEKYYTAHFKDLIRLKSPNQILPLFNEKWSNNLEVKFASSTEPKLQDEFPHTSDPPD